MSGPVGVLLDLLFPPKCVFCGRLLTSGERDFCARCQRELPWLEGPEAEQTGEFFTLCASPLAYRDQVRDSIRRYKFKGRQGYHKAYGRLVAQCVHDHLDGRWDLITWVPLSDQRRRERGYDQAFLLASAAALELNIFLQPTDRHRSAQELEQEYADVVRRVAEAVKIPVSVKLPMRLTNVLAVADSLLARGARGVVMFNRFFEPDIDVERMTFVNGDPFSEPAELRNVLRSVALCTTAVPQLDVSVSTGVHDGEAAVKALLCGANAVQICSAIHEKGYGVIVDINRFIDLWAERHGFGSLAEFRGKMNYGNAESDVYQRVQYMKYFPHDAE